MTRIVLSAVVAVGLWGIPAATDAADAADTLRLLATVAHHQAQSASEDLEAKQQQEAKKKRPVRTPIVGDIKGESTDDKHASGIDVQ